jgi:hypothetical protein
MFKISPGACVATKKKGIPGWFLENFFSPRTDRVHHVIIRGYVPEIGDYEFIESIHIGLFGKGIRHGYLFQEYEGIDVEVYTVSSIDSETAKRAPLELIRFGKSPYDFFLIISVLAQIPWIILRNLIKERRLRRLRAKDFHYRPDTSFLCTEVYWHAYHLVGVDIVPSGVLPFPSAYREALDEGIIELCYKGTLRRDVVAIPEGTTSATINKALSADG